MNIRTLGGLLAIALTTACASFQAGATQNRVPISHWQRYQQGELAGFLRGPREDIVDSAGHVRAAAKAPGHRVELLRGKLIFPPPPSFMPATESPSAIGDIVVEVRGPDPGCEMRMLVTPDGSFDFGPLPDGTYTLKVTALAGQSMPTAWGGAEYTDAVSVVSTITVSADADPAAEIRIEFPPRSQGAPSGK